MLKYQNYIKASKRNTDSDKMHRINSHLINKLEVSNNLRVIRFRSKQCCLLLILRQIKADMDVLMLAGTVKMNEIKKEMKAYGFCATHVVPFDFIHFHMVFLGSNTSILQSNNTKYHCIINYRGFSECLFWLKRLLTENLKHGNSPEHSSNKLDPRN